MVKKSGWFILFFLILITQCNAQVSDTTGQRLLDAFDIFHQLFGKKTDDSLYHQDTELLSKKSLTMIPGFGYSQLRGISLILEGNFSFRISADSKVSVIRFVPQVTFKKYVIPRVTSSIWFNHNKLNLATDWRFYRFIAIDYGMGSQTEESLFNNYRQNYLKLHQTLSREIKPGLLIGAGYYLDKHYGINLIENKVITPENAYNILQKTVSSGLVANILFDSRKNENFPKGGENFINITFAQNLKSLKSTTNYEALTIDFRKFFRITQKDINVLCFRSLNWFTFNGTSPYFDLPYSQGDFLGTSSRPYIEGRFRGKNMVYLESEYRFTLTKNELLGAALFVNASSFSEQASNHFEKVNLGYGASGRMKINKKSNVYFIGSLGFGTAGGHGLFFSLGDVF